MPPTLLHESQEKHLGRCQACRRQDSLRECLLAPAIIVPVTAPVIIIAGSGIGGAVHAAAVAAAPEAAPAAAVTATAVAAAARPSAPTPNAAPESTLAFMSVQIYNQPNSCLVPLPAWPTAARSCPHFAARSSS